MDKKHDLFEEGQKAYQEWRDSLLANPEFREIYKEEAAKKELWLQLVEGIPPDKTILETSSAYSTPTISIPIRSTSK